MAGATLPLLLPVPQAPKVAVKALFTNLLHCQRMGRADECFLKILHVYYVRPTFGSFYGFRKILHAYH